MTIARTFFSTCIIAFLFIDPVGAQDRGDWPTWGHDQERSGWNRTEATLTKNNVSKLGVIWSTQLSTSPTDIVLSTLTAPVGIADVVTPQGSKNMLFLLGADDTLFALDAADGKIIWQKSFPNAVSVKRAATWLCPNTANATPVIDRQKGVIYFITSDGKLRGVALSDGAERLTPTDFVAPFARDWSLNLIDNVVYTTSARGCGQLEPDAEMASALVSKGTGIQLDPGAISAANVRDPKHPRVTHYYTSGGRPAGPWGRGGVAKTPKGIVTQTADGPFEPSAGNFGHSVLELAPGAARLIDSFTPSNWKAMNAKDLDFGSGSPIVFSFKGRTMIATAGKEGAIYLLDASDLGGSTADHSKPLLRLPVGNDAGSGIEPGQGLWGAMSTYESADGNRYFYLPMWGPPAKDMPAFKYSNGPTPNGSIMAFQLVDDAGKFSLVPVWMSPNMTVPDSPVVANGVVYAVQTGEQTLQVRPNLFQQLSQRPAQGAARSAFSAADAEKFFADAAKFRATPVSNLVLYAFDAETGKQLYTSNKIIPNWVHFTEPVVAFGKVFVVTHDAHVYAFGLKH
jgi:outer membrane protein assembly factor BamB